MERFFLVCLGGAIGTGARYLTGLAAQRWFGADFPYGTLIVNLAGAFLIGLVGQLGAGTSLLSGTTLLFLTTGMMGGLTTYSAFSYETVRLIESGAWHAAWLYVVVTTGACLGLSYLGIATARALLLGRG